MPKVPPGTKRVEVYLPPELASRVEAFLHSTALGRVPQGSWNAFFLQRANEFFAAPRLPLGQYAGFPPDSWVSGTPFAVKEIARVLAPTRVTPREVDEAFPEFNPLAESEHKQGGV
jgi:hypothetical protein